MNVLVTGAAGYIGSAVCWRLVERGHKVVALDSLKYGSVSALPPGTPLVRRDLTSPADQHAILFALESNGIEAVCHLAAESLIPLSFEDPALFYRVNVTGGLMLLEAMRRAKCHRIIYSSTSSVYREDAPMPLTEHSPIGSSSCYGSSKLAFETCLPWMRDISWVAFRYFNVCGATSQCWERPYHRNRLIPIAIDTAIRRIPGPMPLNGTDYQETVDHTCVRDFIHVQDIANAHCLALENPSVQGVFNLGIGHGYSNREVIATIERVTKRKIDVVECPRRRGDPPVLIADATKARQDIGWRPQFTTLESMIQSALQFEPSRFT